jgi:hypothetical protein
MKTRNGARDGRSRSDLVRVLYVAGFGRCGSTLVDRLLGQDPHYHSGGELARVWRLWMFGDRPCSCGEPLNGCPFWKAVQQRALAGASSTVLDQLDRYLSTSSRAQSLHKLALASSRRRLILGAPSGFADMLRNLYRALAETADREVIVDSSKTPAYLYLLAQVPGIELRVIHLVRDPRAVAHSWGRSPVPGPDGRAIMPHWGPGKASLLWLGVNAMTNRLVHEIALPYTRIRYEDLVRDTDRVLMKIKTFGWGSAGPLATSTGIGTEVTLSPGHMCSGNPMRFQHGTVQIKEDDAWRREMGARDRYLVETLSLPLLLRYGYGSRDEHDRPLSQGHSTHGHVS